jgi:hypothetical protein
MAAAIGMTVFLGSNSQRCPCFLEVREIAVELFCCLLDNHWIFSCWVF